MIRRDLRPRRARAPFVPLVALLLAAPLGCESRQQPPPRATASARPAPATPTRAAATPAREVEVPVASAPKPRAAVEEASPDDGVPTPRSTDTAPTVAEASVGTDSSSAVVADAGTATADRADRTAADLHERLHEVVELPVREDLLEEIGRRQNQDPTVGEEALHVPTAGLRRMHELYNVWVNPRTKQIVLSAEVCRREGALEMFACLKQTKEHESILSVYTEAHVVHASLEALGVKPGRPVAFDPEYRAATGPEIEITVFWRDDGGKVRESRGQDWVRDIRTKEPLAHPWVFAGSGFSRNQTTGEVQYLAEYGDFICVSNFSSAMIDLPVESSQSEAGLLFEPFTERIPPLGSRVTLVLTPKAAPAKADADEAAAAATGIERHDL